MSPDGREECVSVAPCLFDDPSPSDAPAGHMISYTAMRNYMIISSAVFNTVQLYQHHATSHQTVVISQTGSKYALS